MDDKDIWSELANLCELFLKHIYKLYNQGLINSDQYQEMSELKIKYLEDIRKNK